MSSAHRVADIPELIGFIAAFLSDRHPLLLASRHFFCSVAPFVWRSVPRVDLLLRLIPGTGVWRMVRRDKLRTPARSVLVDVKLPSTLDLTRFDVYAPWVQHLEVFGGEYTHTLLNADALFQLASTRPILPNLRALTLTTSVDTSTAEYLSFTELFLSPKLTEIRHTRQGGDMPYLKILPVPGLVQKIFSICPSVQILELYPGEERLLERKMIFSLPNAPLYAGLARFSNLRSFTSTLYVFESATLQALGSLPLLESLDVSDQPWTPASLVGALVVHETWFPALRRLHLRNFHAKDVSVIWTLPFVRNLESATIKCDPATAGQHFVIATGEAWMSTFLIKLSLESPHISQLELDFRGVASLGQQTFSLSDAGVDSLRRLPLRSIRLHSISVQCEDLVPALLDAEEFYCMDGQIQIEQLRMFAAHMPRLRSLTVDVRWTAYVRQEVSPTANRSSQREAELSSTLLLPPPIVLTSRFELAEHELPITQLMDIAKFLAEIWPGGFRAESYPGTREWGNLGNVKKLNRLNELVSEYLAEVATAA